MWRILILLAAIVIVASAAWYYNDRIARATGRGDRATIENRNLQARLDNSFHAQQTAVAENNFLRDTISSLQAKPTLYIPEASQPIASYPSSLDTVKQLGLRDPVNDIITDLMQHSELIPIAGALGGKMAFLDPSQIKILNSKWVLAYFEDGHNTGHALLGYTVEPGGKIAWKLLAATLD